MLVVSAAALAVQPVSAATLDDINVCNSGAGKDTIAACTRVIGDTTTGKAALARAYVNRALADRDEAVRLAPNAVHGYISRAEIRLHLDDAPGAVEDCNVALGIEPDHTGALALRGNAYVTMGPASRAIQDYDRVIELKPERGALPELRHCPPHLGRPRAPSPTSGPRSGWSRAK